MNEKATNLLMEHIVFLILLVVFVAIIFGTLNRIESNASLKEQIYSKQIALVIDKAEPGMEVELDIYELYSTARKKKFNGKIIEINNEANKVIVKLVQGKGYEYYFFNDVDVVWNLKDDKKLLLKFYENEDESWRQR